MAAEVIDYRVSRIVVLCKDCGQDVGLYPARHKCGIPSSETPPLPSIPKKYLPAGKITDNSQDSKLWNKFLRAASLNNNADYDSDNESEKDGWEGETHISRILREYYENKGAGLPDWLYDSDSTNLNYINNNDNIKSQTSTNYLSLPMDRNRDRIKDRSVPPSNSYNVPTASSLPKNMDSRYNDRRIDNNLLPRGQPFPTSDGGKLMSKRSYQQLRTESDGNIPTNFSSRSHQHKQFIPHDIRGFDYNNVPYKGGRLEVPSSGPYGSSRNNRKDGFF